MTDQELIRDLTESYLKSLIAEASGSLNAEFDSFAAFGELGINSFQVLKIIKKLEADFGTLPKSLLFENFNINDLANYFVGKHEQTLTARFAEQLEGAPATAVLEIKTQKAPVPVAAPRPVVVQAKAAPIVILEKDAFAHPELGPLVRSLYERHRIEGCVSRGTRKIAPYLFIGSEKRGYLHYSRSKNIILVYSYTGPRDYLPFVLEEMHQYCLSKDFQLNVIADEQIPSLGGTPFSATPFGVLQRVLNIRDFKLDGGAMRRLRYQVSKFEKSGACRTDEYRPGTSRETDEAIVRIIDKWCESRTVVNPLVPDVKEEILAGTLGSEHRVFLTYLDDVLQNVILITQMCAEINGYLMDLEFYLPEMPLGGLEFAIVQIIETLAREGRDMLSLGGTYGCKLESSPNADPDIDRILDELREQNIFNDAGNLQFKNKFRPESKSIFLCRPAGSPNPDNVIDIIMMIADPLKMQTAEEEPAQAEVPALHTAPPCSTDTPVCAADDGRFRTLAAAGFNPLNLTHEQVDFDLKTDSWAQLQLPAIDAQMRHLHGQLQQPVNVDDALRTVFPFAHFVLTGSGQAAENIFFKAWPKQGVVPQNLLFPSTIFHQIDKGFTPREIPTPEVFRLQSAEPYKGNIDLAALETSLAQDAASIAMVCIEVGNNAAGGHPVSLRQLRDVRALLAPHAIPLILDVTRIVENAQFLIEQERECAGQSIWAVVREILSCADAAIGSLTKDFCVDKGGIVATNDAKLFDRLQTLVQEEGGGLDLIDRKLIALSLQGRKQIENKVLRRIEAVRALWRGLNERGIPVVQPAGGHCVLIDVAQIREFAQLGEPVASFVAWLHAATGIRAAAHNVGMQQRTSLNQLVRLAVPVGLKREQIDEIIERIAQAFAAKQNIPQLALERRAMGDGHATYSAQGTEGRAQEPAPRDLRPVLAVKRDVAIVGMAGRYPKAKNVHELWENLVRGLDCIEEIPAERYERRLRLGSTAKYRGGFLEEVDRFDSLFFNISPREAEMLDPQERLFLEVAWEVIEDAGYYPEILAQDDASRNIGVYVGAVWAMYQMLGVEEKHLGNTLIPNSFLWSVANRVSYALNLSGPSITLDTACSSSLTAMYLAVEAIQSGECSAAIVGGVNLDLHQAKFDINHQGGALSPDGVPRTFGKGANGYVMGEGIGALLLKPLDQAEKDGDHIYGVIRSAVVNHGGRTSGYTVPNPKAQGDLVAAALKKANVDPRTIGYVEAHGTGTELGDPIEITGLTNAFQSADVPHQTCAIGSVKTNIGHLEAAAGVVGVSKVLLQMQHRTIVPSLHSSELNEFIDFANSPFHVVQTLEEWTAKEVDGVRLPLRAGISSFGAGGANAHVVIEGYEPAPRAIDAPARPLIFPLSARNEEQLRDAAARLAKFIGKRDLELHDVAFTLQQGRKSFEQRLAVVARTKDELLDKLTRFVDGKKPADVVTGHAKSSEGVTRLLNRREKQEFVRMVSQGADAPKLAALWAEGLLSDWQGFEPQGKRISLPTYPFADKRHWVSGSSNARALVQAAAGVHPMVDTNESTFERQLFKKTFHDRDFFIYDHLVSDIPTLPGVAYLELARKAGELAAGRKVQKIRNILWISPIAVQNGVPKDVFIELKPAGDSVQFEVFSHGPTGNKVPHSQGRLIYATTQDLAAAPESIDLAAIRARSAKITDGTTAYPLFKSFGLNLGPSFQVLQDVYKNDLETLGSLRLPEFRHADLESMILQPSLIDGSLQAGVAAQLGSQNAEMVVPFSIGEVEVLHPLQPNCFSYVTVTPDDKKDSRVHKTNVTIVDETGKVLVRIRESVGVPLREVHKSQTADADGFTKLHYAYEWQKAPLAADGAPRPVVLMRAGDDFESLGNDVETVVFVADDESSEPGVFAFLRLCQTLIERKLEGNVQLFYVHTGSPQDQAMGGFVNTLRLEHPKLLCKAIEIPRNAAVLDTIAADLQARTQDANVVRYADGERFVRKLSMIELAPAKSVPIREGGVVLITGGAGGLGLLFAEYLAKEHKAQVVLTGRTPRGADVSSAPYIAADVSNYDDVKRLTEEVRARFGAINGVIHAAGVLRDSLIRNKTIDEMSAVFAPKVHGTRHLDELTKDDDLDFFVTFSSLAAVAGNGGQCDYSFANYFMDAFAAERERRRAEGTRNGRTLSINWSIWAEGGMKLDEQTELIFRKTAGIKPLATAVGVDAFVNGLASGRTQFAVLEGQQDKVETLWGLRKKETPAPAVQTSAPAGDLAARLQKDLTQIVMDLLKVDAADVPNDKILLDLGFDSIGLTTFANAVNEKYGLDITPVLFFDYPSIAEISKHLSAERESDIRRFYGERGADVLSAQPERTETSSSTSQVIEFKKAWAPLDGGQAENVSTDRFLNEPIAIVGMAGVMPQSADLDEFWENLAASTDMISVIPEDRWKWEEYFGDPLKEPNKSNSKWGGFMKEVDKFDPLFFGISPREAQMMDPQQRIFLETVWKAIEDSGQKVSDLSGTRTGLFVGVATNDYADLLRELETPLDGYTASGNSHSVLANRVSYLLNFHGPSAPIDTACSSSLVALHRAIESIHTRSSDMAIVGGVQVMLSPAAYISFSAAGMLSTDGRCKTFDKRANGYVRGEGSGAIFLKRLSDAERDGNHIYAVIKATAENHGGKVTTLTAPNSSAQTDLLVEAYEKAHVDPASVGFIECHGTGTPLGDPIEIQALSKAFSELYKKRNQPLPANPHCGLSSVKTNIGHLETAAGIAGILKALLAIEHKQIPANVHFEELNPYINLKGTPFYIAGQLTPWQAPADGKRKAGISSFGFGGANAHIVLEEYVAPKRTAVTNEPQLIVLSAKNAERLAAYAQSLSAWLDKHEVELVDLAYTLQVGRDEMPARLAIVASSIEDLKRKLASGEKGDTSQDLAKIGERWVSGEKIDWSALHRTSAPRRVSAPTYPFARERYWPAESKKSTAQLTASAPVLHPLIHRNTSTLEEQKFSSRFSGREFFLADHVVETHEILPGVAYLEMARAAGELSRNAKVGVIRNVTFERPLVVERDGRDVEVSLAPTGSDVRFTIKSALGTHCTGKLGYQPNAAEVLDLAAIQSRCSQQVLTGSALYPALNSGGLKLGRSFQIVQSIYATASESLAVLQLPEHLKEDAKQFWLHPALMDGSLHTAIGLLTAGGMEMSLALPYSIGEVQVFDTLHDLHYGYATWADDPKANPGVRRVDFHLLDSRGKVLVRIRDFVSRPLQPQQAKSDLQTLVPAWTPVVPSRVEEPRAVRVLTATEAQIEWLRASVQCSTESDHVVWIAPESDASLIDQQDAGVLALFRAIKSLQSVKKLQWTIVTTRTQQVRDDDALQPAHAAIAGLAGSMAKEFPHWDVRVVDVDALANVSARECLTLPFDKQGNVLAHRSGGWFQQSLVPASLPSQAANAYRDNGVYVVIGGAGGIGEVWSRYVIEHHQANVVWIGRRELDASIQKKIDALAQIGPAPLYISADATNADALAEARKAILEAYPAIHGVVHSAIVLRDQSIARMDESTFRESLSAKVDVSVNLDRVFGGDALDFVLFFSSIVSFFKTPGQSNYAAGCTFKDSFASSLRQRRAYPVRTMNWGYWGSVGVVADEEHNKAMARVGLGSIEPHEGMATLQSLLGSGIQQLALIKTVPVARQETRTQTVTPMANDYIKRLIVEKMSEAVRIDASRIGNDTPFAEFGVDSIAGINFLRLINDALQIELEATSLFEYSTVNQLTQYISGKWGSEIAARTFEKEESGRPRPLSADETSAPLVRFVTTTVEPDESRIEPIAIIGMSGRFAESDSLEAFWQNLAQGRSLIKQVTRWNPSECVMSEANGHAYCSDGSFIDALDQFDPAFFGIPAEEAVYMDPQQRLFLEESWKALEDAGYAGKSVQEKRCGVYVGCGSSNYDNLLVQEPPPQAFWGNSQSVIPARIAYYLDLQGPAIAVDTACSSSLVTIHLACQGLWARETEMALAGGVFLQATPEFYQVANRAGMLSPDGKCYSFDARANGFVPGEGVGVVVLKRLSDALRDGDSIHGVIAGSGINQDGRSNGLIAPNGRAQERLERAVYERFDINPETIQVVEAHATGAVLSDSIEYSAMTRAFRDYTDKTQFCALGTVKTNIGHAATAAGVASVIKLLLALRHRQIPPSLHFETGNPTIDFANGPFYVNTTLKPWDVEPGGLRRAAVNSFGFSGTNAHLVLEEAPYLAPAQSQSAQLVVLSARTADQLQQQARNLLAHLKETPGVSMADLAFSLFAGRMHLAHRFACVTSDQNELIRQLEQWLGTGAASNVCTGEVPDGRVRERAALKKFGNHCIQECRDGADAASYIENLVAIADLWVQGYALEYNALFSGHRIPLPTYPFARERYWVGEETVRAEVVAKTTQTVQATSDDLLTWLENDLAQMVREILGVEDVPLDKVLLELGFDSMGLVKFVKAINTKFALHITPVLFFDHPSIGALAKHLSEAHEADIQRLYGAPRPAPQPRVVETPKITVVSPEVRLREPIAIVGISGVMPQSDDLQTFWENLKNSRDLITEIPRDRWDWAEYFGDPFKEPNKTNSKWGGFINDVDKFDSLFFGISPREAMMMDPQQRIFLETVWKAVEDSGQKVSDLSGTKTGLFVGVSGSDYTEVLRGLSTVIDGYSASGNVHSVLANRVSFLLDLHGPSEPIDTACSSSLVALHRAVESIHTGSSDMAIVGGVQIMVAPGPYIAFGVAGMLSSDGKCKSFDKNANGYVRGEGCGAIFLKPLSRAQAEGNHIYAIVKATAENHGGRVTTLTAPNSTAQSALLIDAYRKANIDPSTVGYIECHGTGTSLGDPIEAQALITAFSELNQGRNASGPHCALASVKTNIGHLEAAAGIAGVLKVLLAIKHKEIPANIHFDELNPYIDFDGTPFYIADKLTSWDAAPSVPRRAGVSSFGFGGANAHVVLEEYIAPVAKPVADEPRLVVLSAKNRERLDAYIRSMQSYLAENEVSLADFAYTLQVGRDEMPERLALVVATVEELRSKFDEVLDGRIPQDSYRNSIRKAARAREAENVDRELIERRELSKLAELWVSGAKIDWRLLYAGGSPRRIALPTYPFARDRHWPEVEGHGRLQSWAPVWKAVSGHAESMPNTVALIGDQLDWLRQSVPNALAFDRNASFDQLLWIASDDAAEHGALTLFRIIKDLLAAGHGSRKLQLTLITRLTQHVYDGDPILPAHAGVAGLAGTLAQEYPNWDVRMLDVESLASVTAAECLALPFDKQGNALAHRRGAWLQQRLERIADPIETSPVYRQGGVYVVIGGAGGVGEVWSRQMIERYKANIVWIGRRAQDAAITDKLDGLAKLGPAPLYIAADATKLDDLQRAAETIRRTHPVIHGVVHSAVVLQNQSLVRLDEAAFRAGYAVKADVSTNMERAFGSPDLDFMVFFSSIASFLKGSGLAPYAAGCTFKDSFAHKLRQEQPWRTKVMNWGYWGSVGAVADDAHHRIMAHMGIASIEPREGMSALQSLIGSDVAQVALVKTAHDAAPGTSLSEAIARHLSSKTVVRKSTVETPLPAAHGTARNYVERLIIAKMAETLSIDPADIATDAPVLDYGLDSISGVLLVRAVNEALQIELEPSKLLEYSTVDEVTGYIVEQWGAQISACIETPVAAANRIHPLLHANTSTLGQQRYSATFAGDEPFLLAGGVLPDAACLEMARAAIQTAAGISNVELCDVVWGVPFVATSGRRLTIALLPGEGEEIRYEISSGDEAVVHCQGRVTANQEPAPARISLESLPSLSVPRDAGGWSIHPAVLADAMRSAQLVRVWAPCSGEVFVSKRKTDVDLVDANGNVCVQLTGLTFGSERAALAPLPRKRYFAEKAPRISDEQVLDMVVVHDAMLDDSYEKVTF